MSRYFTGNLKLLCTAVTAHMYMHMYNMCWYMYVWVHKIHYDYATLFHRKSTLLCTARMYMHIYKMYCYMYVWVGYQRFYVPRGVMCHLLLTVPICTL